MDKFFMEDLEYHILPGKPAFDYEHKDLYNQTFTFWKSFWIDVLKQNGTSASVNVDEFVRQERITILRHGENIVGMHTYSIFDLDCLAAEEHSYFNRFYTADFMASLREKGISRVMTMEYFSVQKNWRASQIGVSLATVLCGLGVRLSRELGADGIITAARSDNGASSIAKDYGAKALIQNVDLYNTPCDLLLFEKQNLRNPKDLAARSLVERLWSSRYDTTLEYLDEYQVVA